MLPSEVQKITITQLKYVLIFVVLGLVVALLVGLNFIKWGLIFAIIGQAAAILLTGNYISWTIWRKTAFRLKTGIWVYLSAFCYLLAALVVYLIV